MSTQSARRRTIPRPSLAVRPGTYTLSVELPGFCTLPRTLIVANDNELTRVDLTLHLAPPNIVDKVLLSLPELVALADAVVHLKVTRSHPARLMIPNMVRVREGVITLQDRQRIPGVADGMLLDELLESLRSVLQERRAGDPQP